MVRIRLLRILFLSIFCIWAFYRMWEKICSAPQQSLAYLQRYSPFPRIPLIQDNKAMEDNKISFDFRSCSLSSVIDTSEIVTPFKIYVYDLPPKFNTDITRRLMRKNTCYSLEYCGMGEKLFDVANDMFVHDTHQFSLEVILHHKLLFSPYRTLDPEKADIFYIPAYIGLHCMEFTRNETFLIDELFDFLQRSTYFRTGKPHFSSVAKIEREMYFKSCPYLQIPETINITYFGVETEFPRASQYGRVLSVPYPSYVHFLHDGDVWGIPDLEERNVFILLCAGKRRSNKYRAQIMDQIPNKTLESFDDYVKKYHIQNQDTVMLYTNECSPKAKRRTIPWMRQSVFCLQPPGDSPTRKSFYDAVLSGCIPVLFPYPKQPLTWAFTNVFNYSEFTVTIPHDAVVTEGKKILDILRAISSEDIQKLHNKVKKISQWFQYTSIDGDIHPHTDAMQVILQELNNKYKFSVDD